MNGITRKPAFWIAYAVVAMICMALAWHLFPLAIPLVNLDIIRFSVNNLVIKYTIKTRIKILSVHFSKIADIITIARRISYPPH